MYEQRPQLARRRVRVPARQARRASWLAISGYAGLGLASLLLGAVTFLLFAQPVDFLRDRIIAELKAGGAGDVAAGAASLSLLPRPKVSVTGVSLASPALTIDRLDAEIGLLALLGGDMRITRLVLTRPRLTLAPVVTPAAGASLHQQRPSAPSPGARPAADKRRPAPDAIALRIIDGRVRFSPTEREIGAIDADLALTADGQAHASGSLAVASERLAFDASLSSLAALRDTGATHLTLRLAGQEVEASFGGDLALTEPAPLTGHLEARGALHALTALLGAAFEGLPDPGPFRLSAELSAGEGRMALTAMDGALGDAGLGGAVTLETDGPRPRLTGEVRLAELDLGRLLLRPAGKGAPASPQRRPGAGSDDADVSQAGRTTGDWSDDRIDLSALALADADLKLAVGHIVYKDFTTGPSELTLALKDRLAKLTIGEVQLYEGRGQGVVTLDGSNKTPAIGANLTLQDVSALPLLKDALGFVWLEGRGGITLALTGQGQSERQVVSGLNGKLAVKMSNGAVRGADAAKILNAIEQVRLEGFSAADKTQFSEFAATFLIANGVAQNQDLRLVAPRLSVTGAGSVALAARSIDYTARTRLLGGEPHPGAVISISNLEIPLRITGPWSAPNVAIAGREGLAATVRQIGKNLGGQDVEDAVKGLLGGDGHTKPADILDKLFKKQP
jgi:AsmA protein